MKGGFAFKPPTGEMNSSDRLSLLAVNLWLSVGASKESKLINT